MPKLTKERSDEIARLLGEGYANLEVAKKAHVSEGTVSRIKSRLKKGGGQVVKSGVSSESSAALGSLLSRESLNKLGAIQVVLGCSTLDEAVDLLHRDVPKLMAYKFKASLDFHGTPAEVFDEVLEALRAFNDATDPLKINLESQARVLSMMGMSWYVKGLYNVDKGSETLVQFMERAVLDSYARRGWVFKKKSKREVLEIDPTLEPVMKGDLVSVFSPRSSSWIFPAEVEDYFGVQTEISDKLAWINAMKPGVEAFWLEDGPEDEESS